MNGPVVTDLPLPQLEDIVYPDSDGEPLGETEPHVRVILDLFHTLDGLFEPLPDVFVISNMLLFYEKGNPTAFKSPDVMVVKGVDTSEFRRSFKIWEEGAVPRVIFEMTSEKTQREDEDVKPDLYARIGVAELFLFDPLDDYLKPRFQGFRLVDGNYVPLVPDEDGGLVSEELGLRMVPEGIYLRLYDLATSRPIISPTMQQLQEAEKRAEEEKQRAEAAEAELAQLRKQLEQLQQKNLKS